MKAAAQIDQIQEAKKNGFKPGSFYKRGDGVRMVEITPGNFVNEHVAASLGVRATYEVDNR